MGGSYKMAKLRQRQLGKIYHNVSRAWKAMKDHGKKLHTTYMTTLKAYWKVKYSCTGKNCKVKAKKACKAARHAAKLANKKARKQRYHFKKSIHKARHHAHKLRKGLKHAIHKLHYVFKKARGLYRHTVKNFIVSYE